MHSDQQFPPASEVANDPTRLKQDQPQPPIRLTVLISGNGSNLQALIDATTITTSSNHDHYYQPKDGRHNEEDEYEANPPSGLQNLLTIVRVISNRKSAYGLQRASRAGIPTRYHNILPYRRCHALSKNCIHDERVSLPSSEGVSSERKAQGEGPEEGSEQLARRRYDEDLLKMILADYPDLIICAGWMHVLSPTFLEQLDAEGKRRGQSQKIPILNLHPAILGEFDGVDAIARAWTAAAHKRREDEILRGVGPADDADEQQQPAHDRIEKDDEKKDDEKQHYETQKRNRNVILETAVTVHHLTERVDGGDPVVVEAVPIYDTDRSLEEFEERMHRVEWRVIVQAAEKVSREILNARRRRQ